MMITLIMVFTSLTVFPMQVAATQGVPVSSITNGGIYYIRNVNSNKYLDVSGAGGNGAQVIQWGFTGNDNQKWKVISYGSYYVLSPVHLNSDTYAFNVYGGGILDNTLIKIYNDAPPPGGSSLWQIVNQGSNKFSLRGSEANSQQNPSKAAVVANGSSSSGANIVLYTYSSGQDYQLWYFEEAVSSDDHGNTTANATQIVTNNDPFGSGSSWNTTALQESYSGTINYSYDIDCFIFQPKYTTRYTFYTTGSFDTYGELYNSSGSLLLSNDDMSTYNMNFKLTPTYNLVAGDTYYIKITGYSSGTGSYMLHAKNVYADMNWSYPIVNTQIKDISAAYWFQLQSGSWHYGLDIVRYGYSINGASLIAASSGEIFGVGGSSTSLSGYYVAVKSDDLDPISSTYLIYIYEHLQNNLYPTYYVTRDITQGESLGNLGGSGQNSSGGSYSPHLHFQININNILWGYLPNDTTGPRKFYDYMMSFSADAERYLKITNDKW